MCLIKISCVLGTDTFSVSLNCEYAVVSCYADDAALAVLETGSTTTQPQHRLKQRQWRRD